MSKPVIGIEHDGALSNLQRQPAMWILGLEPVAPAHPVSPSQKGVRLGIFRVNGDGLLERPAGLLAFLHHTSLPQKSSAGEEVIGFDTLRRPPTRQLAGGQLAKQGLDNA